jgi:hypothetical protein
MEEPPHVHVAKGKQPSDGDAKLWLDSLKVERQGYLAQRDLRRILRIVAERQSQFLEVWYEYKRRTRRSK